MSIRVRPFRTSDRGFLERCLVDLQDHLIRIDPWGAVTRTRGYAERTSALLLRNVRKYYGFVLVAELNGVPAGIVGAWFRRYSKVEQTQGRPSRSGILSELTVLEQFRGNGVGTRLIVEAEGRLKRSGCDKVELGVFHPNAGARRLYRRLGFTERALWMSKRIGEAPFSWAEAVETASRARTYNPPTSSRAGKLTRPAVKRSAARKARDAVGLAF